MPRWVLAIAIFVMGGCGLAYEYTFSKIASDLLGNSVRQWSIVIAVMLFFMGMGAEIQRHIAKRAIVGSLVGSQIALALLGGFGPLLMLLSFAHFPYHFGLIHYGVISSIGLLIGFEIPLISRINEDYSDDIRANLARVLKFDYIGALVGALVWIFVLPRYFTLHEIAYVLAFLSLAGALLCLVCFRRSMRYPLGGLVGVLLSCAVLGYGYSKSGDWAMHAEQRLYSDRVTFATTTPYQHIVITESLGGNLRCYINGHIQFSSADEHIYHELLVHPAMLLAPNHRRVLVLGGGDGMAVREILKYKEVQEIVLVDLDEEMTRLAREHPILSHVNDYSLSHAKVDVMPARGVQQGERYRMRAPSQLQVQRDEVFVEGPEVSMIHVDAATYIRQAQGLFDVIILDFPDPSSPDLAKLYSQHFYGELKNKLSADGFIVQQSTSPYRVKEAFLCIGRTMKSAGLCAEPYHDHVPSFGEWGWWIACHPSHADGEGIKAKLREIDEIPVKTFYLTPDLIQSSLSFGKADLVSENTDITTISHPAVLEHYEKGWKD